MRDRRHLNKISGTAQRRSKRGPVLQQRQAAFQGRPARGGVPQTHGWRDYCDRSEVHPLYSAILSRVTSFDGKSSTVEAGFCPLRMLTPICTARRAMKKGSCEAEAWICCAPGSLSAASISGAPSTAV